MDIERMEAAVNFMRKARQARYVYHDNQRGTHCAVGCFVQQVIDAMPNVIHWGGYGADIVSAGVRTWNIINDYFGMDIATLDVQYKGETRTIASLNDDGVPLAVIADLIETQVIAPERRLREAMNAPQL